MVRKTIIVDDRLHFIIETFRGGQITYQLSDMNYTEAINLLVFLGIGRLGKLNDKQLVYALDFVDYVVNDTDVDMHSEKFQDGESIFDSLRHVLTNESIPKPGLELLKRLKTKGASKRRK